MDDPVLPVVTDAVIWVLPAVNKLAKPVLLMVATLVVPLVHCTKLLKSWVEPSEKVPVALNCCVPVESATVGLDGVTAILVRSVLATSRDPVLEPSSCLAVIVVVPAATAVAFPVLSMVATLGADDVQVAVDVMSFVSPFTVVPDAV